jgi:signal transduction histidine kinase/ActR/RegA family two-component response regulator
VDLVGEDGRVERVEVAHADPALAELATRVRDVVTGENARHPPTQALRSGRTVLITQFTAEIAKEAARDEEHLRTIRELEVRSLLSAPLLARGRTLGVLTFLTTESSGRQYGEADVLLVEEVARRAALAIDNARLFSLAQAERQRAEEANRLKDDFLATVSHELRTPLTAMLGWVKMLRTGRLPVEKREKALETVDRNAQVQAQLVEDLLDVSRIISGKLRLEPRPVHLADIIQAAMESVRPAADAKDIRLQPELASPGEDLVMGDPGRLQQVVWNLLSNAVKFSPGGSRVRALLRRVDGSVEVAVVDEGPGIPADFLPHVFERFRQLESGTTRRHGGLGLGLAIVRHLVEQHGGTVHVASEGPGRGATFTVRLPPAQPRAPQADAAPPRRSGSFPVVRAPAAPTLAQRRILVVDDEEDNREVLKMLLEECGAHVVTAASAAEAFQALRETKPELLVSDIGMPGEDGYGLIARVRALPATEGGGVPAVALTAYARVEDRTRALTAGFDMHVAKPVEPAELLSLLTHLIAASPAA